MKYFYQLLLWGCVLGSDTVILRERPFQAYPLTSQILGCDHNIRVIFTSDDWAEEIGGGLPTDEIVLGHFFVGIMETVVTSTNESGIQCIFDKSNHVLTCCDSGNLDKYQPMGTKELTTSDKFFGYDISNISLLFLFLNLFFFSFLIAWGYIFTVNNAFPLAPLELNEIGGAV